MDIFYSPTHLKHAVKAEFDGVSLIPGFEIAARVEVVREALMDRKCGTFRPPEIFGLDPILAVHDSQFVRFLEEAFVQFQGKHGNALIEAYPSSWPARRLRQIPGNDIDGRMGYYAIDTATPILSGTWEAATSAVNCALSAAKSLSQGASTAFALCRPPGHHAATDLYGGYCFFNNAAIAAHWFSTQGARIAILDVDYHHGNGTQDIFYSRNDVLTVSIHADPSYAYPHFLGYSDEIGQARGEGFNINLPLAYGTQWNDYAVALTAALAHIKEFSPDILIVPLGLDTYERDPISKFRLRQEDYFALGADLRSLNRPMLVTMEGGYAVDDLGHITANALEGILNG